MSSKDFGMLLVGSGFASSTHEFDECGFQLAPVDSVEGAQGILTGLTPDFALVEESEVGSQIAEQFLIPQGIGFFVRKNRGSNLTGPLTEALFFWEVEQEEFSGFPLPKHICAFITALLQFRGMYDSKPTELLLIEDEASILKMMKRFLDMSGFSVRTAQTHEEAAKALEGGGVQLVICDGALGGSGDDLEESRRAEYQKTDDVLRPFADKIPVLRMSAQPLMIADLPNAITGCGIWSKPMRPTGMVTAAENLAAWLTKVAKS